jgi:hypothetical protein
VVWRAIVGLAGVTAIDTSAGATDRLKLPLIPCRVALITTVPLFFAVSMPPAATLATAVSEELQVTELVRSWLLPPA